MVTENGEGNEDSDEDGRNEVVISSSVNCREVGGGKLLPLVPARPS